MTVGGAGRRPSPVAFRAIVSGRRMTFGWRGWLGSTPSLLGMHLPLFDFGKCGSDQFTIHGTSPHGMRSTGITVSCHRCDWRTPPDLCAGDLRRLELAGSTDVPYTHPVITINAFGRSAQPLTGFQALHPPPKPGDRSNRDRGLGRVPTSNQWRIRQARLPDSSRRHRQPLCEKFAP